MSSCCEKHAHSHLTAIETQDLSVRLDGRLILERINLRIQQGEMIALIGPNGAGKTTLLKALLGLIPVESGSVKFFGGKSFSDVSHRIGYVPQKLVADPSFALNVREFLALNLDYCWPWTSKKIVDRELNEMICEIGIKDILSRSVAELSGGQFQRVMIAFALLKKPEILFLDEPTAGVDAPGEESFYEMIEKIHKERHLSIVLVSHDLSMVYKHASRVYALNQVICCHGTPEEVLQGQNLNQVFGQEFSFYHHHHSH